MKAKLIHRGNGDYKLYVNGATYAQSAPNPHRKLSKQNCDDIFGVIDVEKIADRHTFGQRNHEWKAYVEGFNKAMELMKDKLTWFKQPTEIEVDIVTEPMNIDEIREQGKGFLNANTNKPKLDSEGCLILKKIED